MSDSKVRFTDRAENYAKYRPGYPAELIDLLKTECGLGEISVVADIGSGTGILTELLLRQGAHVFAVEPNQSMRKIAEVQLSSFAKFRSIDATAEATSLDSGSVDIVTAAQAFHWFNVNPTKMEFIRILKPCGWVVLIWNERLIDATPFLREYERLLLKYGTDYQIVRHENAENKIEDFFAPEKYFTKNLDNQQRLDFESLKGRLISSSYTPPPGHPNFEPMLALLEKLFSAHEQGGTVTIEYVTRVYYGNLDSRID
jgi:SAM-dependent methyltransferase